jgi:hypothetical protein
VTTAEPEIRVTHPTGSRVLIWGGAGLTVVGAAGMAIGWALLRPSNCMFSNNRCAAAPGDPVFDKASTAKQLYDAGFIAAAVGAVALGSGLVWYFSKAHTETDDPKLVMPMILRDGAGLAWTSSF